MKDYGEFCEEFWLRGAGAKGLEGPELHRAWSRAVEEYRDQALQSGDQADWNRPGSAEAIGAQAIRECVENGWVVGPALQRAPMELWPPDLREDAMKRAAELRRKGDALPDDAEADLEETMKETEGGRASPTKEEALGLAVKGRPKPTFEAIIEAMGFVSAAPPMEHEAYLCRETGEVHWYGERSADDDPLPDDIDEPGKYVFIPHKNDLNLGKALALEFAANYLPEAASAVDALFQRPGAYAGFKDLLACHGKLEHWFEYEKQAQERELRIWCRLNKIEVDG